MIIAIDLDKTLFSCESVIYKVLTKIQTPSNINKKLKYKTVQKQNDVNVGWVKSLLSIFNPDKYSSSKKAIDCINTLFSEDNQIILLSSRPYNLKVLRNAALKWLHKNNVHYDSLIFGCGNKAAFCEAFNVDILIDDKLTNCQNAILKGTSAINICESKKKADKVREQNKDNKDLFVVSDWTPIHLITQMIKYKRSHAPTDFERIGNTIYNESQEFVDINKKEFYIKFITDSKLADYVVVEGKVPPILNKEAAIKSYLNKTNNTPTKKWAF